MISSHRRLVLLIAVCMLAGAAAHADWKGIGDVTLSSRGENTLTFEASNAIIAVTAISPEIIRVRIAPGEAFGRDHSYALTETSRSGSEAMFRVETGRSFIATSSLSVEIGHHPFRLTFRDRDGNVLDEDDPEMGTAMAGEMLRVWKRLRDDEHVYGFGEKTRPLDKRGAKLGGTSVTMWNSDTYAYDAGTDPIYASVPFFMVLRNGRAHGIFLDNTFRSNFDVGHQHHAILSFGADGGELDYYFIDGPSPKEVVERFTALTGRITMPPLWALGYHQSRWSYYPEDVVRDLAKEFRSRKIPADVLWLDIHYLDGYLPFTWDRERFPDPKGLIGDLRRQGFRTVTIIDPHPGKVKGNPVYESGIAGDHFVRNADGSVFEAPVWPAQAEHDPAPSVFPDFSRAATRRWWGQLYGPLLDAGVAGIWNDMNEPAVFDTPTGTMPLEVRHANEGEPSDHREIHNVYGMLMTEATRDGLLALRPDDRPFVLTRATFAGGQRYAAVWPGDNTADWSALRGSLSTLLGLGISGFPFVGADIGGFVGAPSSELYTRWLQFGVFNPFMRSHTSFGTPPQDPWSYGPDHETINRRAIEMRYELLPTIYDRMHEASVTGIPPLRPMFMEFPEDERTWSMQDQFMFGPDILVAPVMQESAKERGLYLPAGGWTDFQTGERLDGGRYLSRPVTLDSIPVFIRDGAFVFEQPVVQHTGEMPGKPLRVRIFPATESMAVHYEDDGMSNGYLRGEWVSRRFGQKRSPEGMVIEISGPEGDYRPAPRSLEMVVAWPERPPSSIRWNQKELVRVPAARLEDETSAWTIQESLLVIRIPDRFETTRVTIE